MKTISDYKPPLWLRNGHIATIYPGLFRKVNLLQTYDRERITTEDQDFLDLDWLREGRNRLVIISHGLEGSSERPYMRGMAQAFWASDFDVLAWNFRSCSEEMNKTLKMYHSGATDDLQRVVDHALSSNYQEIFLVGFSLGGNLTLKYLGEAGAHSKITKAVTFSVPLDLAAGSDQISRAENRLYEIRFLRSLKGKVRAKHKQFPTLDISTLEQIQTLRLFDEQYTAPLHGFDGAADYYRQCSSRFFIDSIKTPTLVVNAANDPFLPSACLDPSVFESNTMVSFERPTHGGHCGFASYGRRPWYWSEERAVAYCLMDQ